MVLLLRFVAVVRCMCAFNFAKLTSWCLVCHWL